MSHLYIAARSDNQSVLKVGRSDNPARRCEGLQCSHCFEVKPLAIWPEAGAHETAVHRALESMREPGPGREWFRATPMEVYSAVALVMGQRKRRRSPSPERGVEPMGVESMARDLLRRLQPVRATSAASPSAEVEALANQLYGALGSGVLSRAGLVRVRTTVGGRRARCNRYFYTIQSPSDRRYFVAVARREEPPPSAPPALHARVIGGGV